MARVGTILSILLSLVAAGCGSSYYIVNDPYTGKTYYTRDLDRFNSGNISFKDEKTGKTVSIQNSEVQEVTADDYKKAFQAAAPAPVPAPKPALPPVSPTR